MLHQNLSLTLGQKLSPQQIHLMKLMVIPSAQIEQRIKEEMEINPALEMGNEDEYEDSRRDDNLEAPLEPEDDDGLDDPITNEADFDESGIDKDNDVDMSEYYNESDDDIADYKTKDPSEFGDRDDRTIPIGSTGTFHEYLEEQLSLMELDERETQIAQHIIGSLDDDGYLRRELDAIVDDLAFRQNIHTNERELERILVEVQKMDPAGIGARNLEECLLIQLRRKENPTIYVELAIRIVSRHFEMVARKHFQKLEATFNMSPTKLKRVLEEIKKLNPKPGSAFYTGTSPQQLIIPDFIISASNGELSIALNNSNAPELRISRSFKDMISTYNSAKMKSKSQKDAILFIKQKIDSAKWFIDAIQQRQRTLLSTMQTILEMQYDFFLTGDETKIKPMVLRDIAEKVGADVSTMSRVTNSKYVQTEFGTFLLKTLFSEAVVTDSGEEASSREVKKLISDMINEEDKTDPITDNKLTDVLVQKGYNVTRRTISKYREQLGFSVARLRTEL